MTVADAVRFEDTATGLRRAVISSPAAEAEIYLQGAHISQWTPAGQRPVLFLSSRSLFAPGKAIRGGVPVIFPWFGPRSEGKPGAAHGFARTLPWTVESTRVYPDKRVEVRFELQHEEFSLRFRATAGTALEMELQVTNRSESPVSYEEALHTYLAVADVERIHVTGLEGTTFIDKTDGMTRKVQGPEPLGIAKETDQVHLNTEGTCTVTDPVWKRRIAIEKTGSRSTVLWNPWSDKTAGMPDMGPDEWRNMVCIETANAADNAVSLEPGATHTMSALIRLE